MDLLDSKSVVYTVIGLLPNLFLILWAIARLSRDVRILYAKLSLLEGELRLVDQGVNQLSEQARVLGAKVEGRVATPPPDPNNPTSGSGGFW